LKAYNYFMTRFFIGHIADRFKLNPRNIRYYGRRWGREQICL